MAANKLVEVAVFPWAENLPLPKEIRAVGQGVSVVPGAVIAVYQDHRPMK